MSEQPIAPGDDKKQAVAQPANATVNANDHKKSTSGLAVAGLVLGLIALLSCWIPLFNVITTPFAILGLVFGIIGIVATAPAKPKGGRGIAIAGTVLCAISLVVFMAMYGGAAASSGSDGHVESGSGSTIESTDTANGAAKADDSAKDGDNADATKVDASKLAIGDTYVGDNGLKVTVDKMKKVTPKYSNSTYIAVHVVYKNTGDSKASYNVYEWNSEDKDGAVISVAGQTFLADDALNSGELKPGGKTSGWVYFEKSAKKALYSSNVFADESAAWVLK